MPKQFINDEFIAKRLIFLIMTYVLYMKYGPYVRGVNLCLIISWVIESILALIIRLAHPIANVIPPKWLTDGVLQGFSRINQIIFFVIMFNLKAMQIYMDPTINDDNAIKRSLDRLEALKCIVFMLFTAYGVGFVVVTSNPDLRNTPELSKNALIFEACTNPIVIATHIYLINMGFQ